jgi:phage-related protein
MARRSILSAVRDERPAPDPVAEPVAVSSAPRAAGIRPSRVSKLHIGGYFEPTEPTVMAFQKLKVDLRRSQQDMLLEALRDFVAKHEAEKAFRQS